MAITVIYSSKKPHPFKLERFVRALSRPMIDEPPYYWCARDPDTKLDFQHGRCDAVDLPPEVRSAADALKGYFPSYVPWPL